MAAKDPGEINISMNKNTMRSDIEHYIQRLISTGVYKPGDRIVETRLAKELNVSQAPVREAILELSVMLLSAKALLDLYPHPTREQIKKEMEGNICRCTGYERIADAVLLAAERMTEQHPHQ